MTSEGVIEIENVTKKFGDVIALDNVSLTIRDGEFFTLLGPSGAGKSTLLHMIGGFVEATSGQIRINGEDVTSKSPQERPVSTVFQEYALFPHMSVADNVRYGLDVKGIDRDEQEEIIGRYLGMLQIEELYDRAPAQLSGGQRQRVALARSLAVEPEILLLDEPLGPLDEKLRREMQVELKELQESLATTFIYVTHDQEEALTMSDRMCILHHGELIEVGTPTEIYNLPHKRFTAEFIGAGNLIDGTLQTMNGEYATMAPALGSNRITGRNDLDEETLEEGAPVSVVIRSNDFETGTANSDNELTGTVTTAIFKGDVYEYVVELEDGHEVHAAFNDPLDIEEGKPITLTWSKDNCVVVIGD